MSQRTVGSTVQEPAKLETRGRGAVSGAGDADAAGGKGLLEGIWNPLQAMAKRTAIYVAFLAAKQPSRIKQVLNQVGCSFPPARAVCVMVIPDKPLFSVDFCRDTKLPRNHLDQGVFRGNADTAEQNKKEALLYCKPYNLPWAVSRAQCIMSAEHHYEGFLENSTCISAEQHYSSNDPSNVAERMQPLPSMSTKLEY